MGKSLKNLHNSAGQQNSAAESAPDGSSVNPDQVKTAEAKLGKYRNMNENQLMSELMSKMDNAKNTGNFDPDELEKFYYQMAPHLSVDQRNRMRSLINMLKG